MRCPACKPSTEASIVWQTLDLSHPLGKSWRARLFTLQPLRTGSPTSPEWGGRQRQLTQGSRLSLSDAEGALLKSQGGPLASVPFVRFPTNSVSRLEPQTLRVLFLRRLRLLSPSPLAFADVAVLSTSLANIGRRVLSWGRWDAFLWKTQSAARLVGGSEPMSLSETWTSAPWTSSTQGGSRLWWTDCPSSKVRKMAIDTTLVCPLTREGVAQPRTATVSGARLEVLDAGRRHASPRGA